MSATGSPDIKGSLVRGCSEGCCGRLAISGHEGPEHSKLPAVERCGERCCQSLATSEAGDSVDVRSEAIEENLNACCEKDIKNEGDVQGECCGGCSESAVNLQADQHLPEAAKGCADECCVSQQGPSPQTKDDCCRHRSDSSASSAKGHDDADALQEAEGCAKNCYSSNEKLAASADDAYYGERHKSDAKLYAAKMKQENDDLNSQCCEGKQKPCCDESCIDRLNVRGYEMKEDISVVSTEKSDCCKNGNSKACSPSPSSKNSDCCRSAETTREIYRGILKAFGCICSTLLAKAEASCCLSSRQPSNGSKRAAGKICKSRLSEGACKTASQKSHRKAIKPNTSKTCGKGCCDVKEIEGPGEKLRQNQDPCCGSTGLSQHDKICGDDAARRDIGCCVTEKPKIPQRSRHHNDQNLSSPDLENGFSQSKHVALTVSGMTCVGCETKLQRSLATIKAIRNLKTSLVLCRAEFDLDLRHESVDSIIHQLQRMTEFQYEEIFREGSEIEIRTPHAHEFAKQESPSGVFAMTPINKTTVRVSFDPCVVGARDLIERHYGRVLEIAPLKPDQSQGASSRHVRQVGLMTLLSASLTIPVLVLAWAPIPGRPVVYGGVSLALATFVQFVVAGPFYPTALKSLIFSRMIEVDLLIVLSTTAAYIFSLVSFAYTVSKKPLSTGEFFETSTLLVTIIMFSRFMTALARQKAAKSVSVRSLQTPTAVIVSEQDNSHKEIDARLLQYGDLFRVAPESRFPTDGTVIFGTSEVDESMITGESKPVVKTTGSAVVAGAINGAGVLTVRLSRLPGSNTISTIANMVDEAKLSKPKIQDIADRVASYFVPVIIVVAVLTFIIWIAVGLSVRGQSGSRAVTEALTYGITVFIVSCPCAIGLAVPMVIVIAGGVAANHGVVFKTAETIEIARKTSHVVFDKTGTLTQGRLTPEMEKYFGDNNAQGTQAAVFALVHNVKHPVAIAVKRHLESHTAHGLEATGITVHTGKGIEGKVNGKVVKAGNSRWLGFNSHPDVQKALSQGLTAFCITIDDELKAIYGLQDLVRPSALPTISSLQKRGVSVSLISGDDDGPVNTVAHQLGITNVRPKCTPVEKQAFMQELTQIKGTTSIFCGDGTNDAVALAQATIGVHMSGGTDVAQSAADAVLVGEDLGGILTLIDLSKASMRRIIFNFAWSFVYNTLAFLLGSGALVKARIPPAYAALGELVSVLPVIAIAMGLKWTKFSRE